MVRTRFIDVGHELLTEMQANAADVLRRNASSTITERPPTFSGGNACGCLSRSLAWHGLRRSQRRVPEEIQLPSKPRKQRLKVGPLSCRRLPERGVPTGEAVTALAVALGNEIAALVMRNPSLTVDEMADLVCQSVREAAHYTVSPSSDVPQDVGELTEPEFAQLTMRIINTAMPNATIRDAMSATAMALGYRIATAARRDAGFDDTLRWGQNAVIDCAREARDRLARKEK